MARIIPDPIVLPVPEDHGPQRYIKASRWNTMQEALHYQWQRMGFCCPGQVFDPAWETTSTTYTHTNDNGLIDLNQWAGGGKFLRPCRTSNPTQATAEFTITGPAGDGDTVVIDGVTYTFRNTLSTAFDVKIEGLANDTLDNLRAAINLDGTAGVDYATGTTEHPSVSATRVSTVLTATAKEEGYAGNAIAVSETHSNGSWSAATLTGGGELAFRLQIDAYLENCTVEVQWERWDDYKTRTSGVAGGSVELSSSSGDSEWVREVVEFTEAEAHENGDLSQERALFYFWLTGAKVPSSGTARILVGPSLIEERADAEWMPGTHQGGSQAFVAGAGSLTLEGQQPAVVADALPSAGAGALTFTGLQPIVVASGNVVIEAGAGSLTFTGQQPTVVADPEILAGAGSLTFAGQQPTVVATVGVVNVTVAAGLGTLTFTGQQPTVVATDPFEDYISSLGPVHWYKMQEGIGATIDDYGSANVDQSVLTASDADSTLTAQTAPSHAGFGQLKRAAYSGSVGGTKINAYTTPSGGADPGFAFDAEWTILTFTRTNVVANHDLYEHRVDDTLDEGLRMRNDEDFVDAVIVTGPGANDTLGAGVANGTVPANNYGREKLQMVAVATDHDGGLSNAAMWRAWTYDGNTRHEIRRYDSDRGTVAVNHGTAASPGSTEEPHRLQWDAGTLIEEGQTPPTTGTPTTTSTSNTTSHTVNLPGSISAGDLLLALVVSTSAETFTPPAGWSAIDDDPFGSGDSVLFAKDATGSEGATASFTTGGNTYACWHTYKVPAGEWRDTGTLTDAIHVGIDQESTGTGPDPGSCSPAWASGGRLFLAACYVEAASATAETFSAYPSGYEGGTNTTVTRLFASASLATATKTAVGTSDNAGAFTKSGSADYRAVTYAIRPSLASNGSGAYVEQAHFLAFDYVLTDEELNKLARLGCSWTIGTRQQYPIPDAPVESLTLQEGTSHTVDLPSADPGDLLLMFLAVPDEAENGEGTTAPYPESDFVTETGTGAGTEHVVNLPSDLATIQAGDLLLVFCSRDDGDHTITRPEGWETISNEAHDTASLEGSLFARRADGTEGATATWTTSVSLSASWHAYRIPRGQWYDNGTLADAIEVGTTSETTGTTPNPPSLTTTWTGAANLFIAVSFGISESESYSAIPSGYTSNQTSGGQGGSGASIGSAFKTATANTEDAGTFTKSGSGAYIAQTFAIRPPAAPSITTPTGWTEIQPPIDRGGMPSVRSTNSEGRTTDGAWDVDQPADVEAGDLLILHVCCAGDDGIGSVSTPTGYSGGSSETSGGVRVQTFWKWADGTEAGGTVSITVGNLGAAYACTAAIQDTRGPWDETGGAGGQEDEPFDSSPSTTNDPPLHSPLRDIGWNGGYLYMATYGSDYFGTVSGAPTNYGDFVGGKADAGTVEANAALAFRQLAAASDNPGTFSGGSSGDTGQRTATYAFEGRRPITMAVYAKIADGNEGASVTVTTAAANLAIAQVYRTPGGDWYGSDLADNVLATTPSFGVSDTPSSPQINVEWLDTDEGTKAWAYAYMANDLITAGNTPPTGYTGGARTQLGGLYPVVEEVTEYTGTTAINSHPVDMPATVNEGDLLLILCATDGNRTHVEPSGWDELADASEGFVSGAAFMRRADGTEGGTTVNVVLGASATDELAAQVYRIRRGTWRDTGTLTDAVTDGTPATGYSTTPDPPSVTSHSEPMVPKGVMGTLVIAWGSANGSRTVSSAPTGYTDTVTTDATGATCYSAREELSSAASIEGNTNPSTFTISASVSWVAHTISVAPNAQSFELRTEEEGVLNVSPEPAGDWSITNVIPWGASTLLVRPYPVVRGYVANTYTHVVAEVFPAADLVCHFQLGERSTGTTINSAGGSGTQTGTITGVAETQKAKPSLLRGAGYSMEFVGGASGMYATIGTSTDFNAAHNTNDFGLIVTFTPDQVGAQVPIVTSTNSSAHKGIRISQRADGTIDCYVTDGTTFRHCASTTKVKVGETYTVAFYGDGSSLFVMVNGEVENSAAPLTVSGDATNAMHVGKWPTLPHRFDGRIQDVIFLDNGPSVAELREYWHSVRFRDYVAEAVPDVWVTARDRYSLWQDTSDTTQADAAGDPVLKWDDQTAAGRDFQNASSTLDYEENFGPANGPCVDATGNASDTLATTATWLHGTTNDCCCVFVAESKTANSNYWSGQGVGGGTRVFFEGNHTDSDGDPGIYDGSSHKSFEQGSTQSPDVYFVEYDGGSSQVTLYLRDKPIARIESITTFEQTVTHFLLGQTPDVKIAEYAFVPNTLTADQKHNIAQQLAEQHQLGIEP